MSATRNRPSLASSIVIALGIVAAASYGLAADDPYRSLPDATVLGAKAQDVCSLVVAAALIAIAARRRITRGAYLVWLGLLAYVVYSYAIYLTGVPMNRMFLVYVVITSVSGAALLGGLLNLTRMAWSPPTSRRLRRGTGWLLIAVSVLFAGLWLSTLLPFALGGANPTPEGVGGTPYPVFVLDLVVVLPCLAAIGVALLRGRPIAGPLAVVALIKIVTLFAALWAGPLVALVTGETLHLGPDAVPSVALLAVAIWLSFRWLRELPAPQQVPARSGAVSALV